MLSSVVCEDFTALSSLAAELMHSAITRAVSVQGIARVALSGGSTPRQAYRALAGLPFDRERTHWFWVDERSVPPTSDRSNFAMARDELLVPADVPPQNVFRMAAEREPIAQAASDYANVLLSEFGLMRSQALEHDSAGRSPLALDLVIAGIGPDGHTASLFPGTGAALQENALVTAVWPGHDLEPRMTLTRPVLVGARKIIVLCSGTEKKRALAAARVSGSEDEIPARIYHRARPGAVALLVDRDALS